MPTRTSTEELLQAILGATDEQRGLAVRALRGSPPDRPAIPLPEPLLPLVDVARALHIHPSTLWRWRIPGHRLAGRPRYRVSEVERYLASADFEQRANELRAARRHYRESKEAQG